MIAFAVFAGLVLGLPVLGLLPPLRQGRAFNAIAHVAMPERAHYGARWASVLAQEVVEWWAAWAGAFLIALGPAIALAGLTPTGFLTEAWLLPIGAEAPFPHQFGFATPLLALAAWAWRRTKAGERQLEYLGWGAEWLHGRGQRLPQYRDLPLYADRMRLAYPRLFGRMTSLQLQHRLESRFWLARILLALLSRRIGKAAR